MKVLHIINSLNTGGAEKLLLDSLPRYVENGISTDLLVLNGSSYPFLTALKEKKCCSVFDLGNGSIYNPILILKLIPYLKNYNIVHAHLFPSLYWLALAKVISLSSTKIVYTEHNTGNKRRNNLFYQIIEKFIYRIYDKIITIADEVDVNLKKHLGLYSEKIQLINNGVDTALYAEVHPYMKSDFFSAKDYFLIQVSSFREQKDQTTLIRALNELPNNYKLILVGTGPLLETSKNLVKTLGLKDRVKFLGNRMDIPALLKTADIVILSSYHEGLSLSSIEAMASGKPLVASDVPGLTEIVKDAGLLFQQGDEKELAQQILALSENENYYNKIVAQCLERAKQYDIKNMVDEYINLYKEL